MTKHFVTEYLLIESNNRETLGGVNIVNLGRLDSLFSKTIPITVHVQDCLTFSIFLQNPDGKEIDRIEQYNAILPSHSKALNTNLVIEKSGNHLVLSIRKSD